MLAKVEAPAQNDMLDTFAKEEVVDEAEEDPNMCACSSFLFCLKYITVRGPRAGNQSRMCFSAVSSNTS